MSKLKQLLFSLNETDRSVIEEKLKEKDQQIDQLKQQLDESFTEEDVNGLIDDRNKTIKFLQKQLAEKVKEIELLKHLGSHETNMELFKENTKLIIEKRQFAIQELEKVKVNLKDSITMMSNKEHSYLQKVVSWYDICNQVNKQIKELKGGD